MRYKVKTNQFFIFMKKIIFRLYFYVLIAYSFILPVVIQLFPADGADFIR